MTIGQTAAAPVPPTAAVSPSSLAVAPVGSAITLDSGFGPQTGQWEVRG